MCAAGQIGIVTHRCHCFGSVGCDTDDCANGSALILAAADGNSDRTQSHIGCCIGEDLHKVGGEDIGVVANSSLRTGIVDHHIQRAAYGSTVGIDCGGGDHQQIGNGFRADPEAACLDFGSMAQIDIDLVVLNRGGHIQTDACLGSGGAEGAA